MEVRFIFLIIVVFHFLGCGSQQIKNDVKVEAASSPFGVVVKDWYDFLDKAERFDYFALAFSELVKRGELDKLKELWSIEAALGQLEPDLSSSGKELFYSLSWKLQLEKALKGSGARFCSSKTTDWYFVEVSEEKEKNKSITFRTIDNNVPVWCRFDFYKVGGKYKMSSVYNLSVDYSTNDFILDIDKVISKKGGFSTSNSQILNDYFKESKLATLLKIADSGSEKNTIIAGLDRSEVKDLGIVYMAWLLEKKEYDAARSEAYRLSVKVQDSYFDAYTGYWVASEEGNSKEAINYLYRGLQYAPTDAILFYFLLEEAIEYGDYELAKIVLSTLTKSFGQNLKSLEIETLDGGNEFLRSSHYKRWLNAQSL